MLTSSLGLHAFSWARARRKKERGREADSLSGTERDGEREREREEERRRERPERRSREEEKGHDVRREEDGARKAGKSELEDHRPKTHRESVVVAPTDGRTDGRHKQRISSSVYSPCIVHARERARGPLYGARRYRLSCGGRASALAIGSDRDDRDAAR